MSILPAPPGRTIARAGLSVPAELAVQLAEAAWGHYRHNQYFMSKGRQFWEHPKAHLATVAALIVQGVDVNSVRQLVAQRVRAVAAGYH